MRIVSGGAPSQDDHASIAFHSAGSCDWGSIATEIKKLYQRLGKTTIYVTHDQVEAMTLASRIAVMHQGTLQQFAEPRTVYAGRRTCSLPESPAMNFLPAQIADSAPGKVVLTGEDGEATHLPLPVGVAKSGDGGRRVVAGISPENLTRYLRHEAEETPYCKPLKVAAERNSSSETT